MFIDYIEVEDAWGTVGISRDRFAPVNLWNLYFYEKLTQH